MKVPLLLLRHASTPPSSPSSVSLAWNGPGHGGHCRVALRRGTLGLRGLARDRCLDAPSRIRPGTGHGVFGDRQDKSGHRGLPRVGGATLGRGGDGVGTCGTCHGVAVARVAAARPWVGSVKPAQMQGRRVKSAQKCRPYQHGIAVCPQNARNRALSLASAENAPIHLTKFVFCLTSTHTHEQV